MSWFVACSLALPFLFFFRFLVQSTVRIYAFIRSLNVFRSTHAPFKGLETLKPSHVLFMMVVAVIMKSYNVHLNYWTKLRNIWGKYTI